MKILTKSTLFIAIIASVFVITGCFDFGGGEEVPEAEGTALYENNVLSISVPKEWDILEEDDFTSEVPQETLLVVRNNVKNENFTANINVVRKKLIEPLSSKDFAIMTNNRQSGGLPDYRETRKDAANISVGGSVQETFIVGFEARKTPEDRLINYLQIYAVKDDFGYIATGSASPQEGATVTSGISSAIGSFALK
jgi:hypothetical protein